MDVKDLREQTDVRPRKWNIQAEKRLIDFDLVEDVERIFDREDFVSDILDLLNRKRLDDEEILTIPAKTSPISGVRFGERPTVRETLKRRIDKGEANQIIKPSPKVSVFVTIGWPNVEVAPVSDYKVEIQDVSAAKEADRRQQFMELIREAVSRYTYFLTVKGETYPIESISDSELTLSVRQTFDVPQKGMIHNNANKALLVAERIPSGKPQGEGTMDRSRRRAKDYSAKKNGAISPVLSFDTVPGQHSITIVAEGDEKHVSREMEKVVGLQSSPKPTVEGVDYEISKPPKDPPEAKHMIRNRSNLTGVLNIEHPRDKTILLGINYRIGSRGKNGEFKYEEPHFINFSHDILNWQLKDIDEVESKNQQFRVLFGDYNPLMEREVNMTFLDEMGRTISTEKIKIEAEKPSEGIEYRPHKELEAQFGQLAYESSTPVEIDLKGWYERGKKQFEDIKGKAESIVEGRDREELEREELEKPVADLRIDQSQTSGLTVAFDASQSSHPNGLELEYRFDFEADGAWDTIWTDDPTAIYSYPKSGTYRAIVEVRDEINSKDQAAISASISS